ncbi:GNAT family N-acetyltransferase [Brevundimonas sp. LM2]|uniref:GNAT family N-acetyltransferase n=1 Tax=Brevundimonas sp. LM2 TaxID=1938605 RepID=UPI0009839EF2|nr:GNAT family N-acetyltransferase [Brevundimonas sp. LM2]AQR60693.1 GNAT family N-acetyltransferase [Brevundimonas sp. LM2]
MTGPTSPLGPTLETERLILRPTAMADFERWADFQGDAETTRFIGGPKSPAEVWRVMMSVAGAWALTGESFFSVIEKDSGRWIGRIGPWTPHQWPGREVGWSLHRDATGRGYALEAAVATMDYAFDVLGWEDAIHSIDPGNQASQALAARLGSVNRGPGRLPPPYEDATVDLWGQTRSEWAVNRRRFPG